MNENTSLFIENSCNTYVLVGDSPMTVIVIESNDKKGFKVK